MTGIHDYALFVAGMLASGYLVVALFFGRFWHRTRDPLFLYFSASFLLLFVQCIALALAADRILDPIWYRGMRLLAFVLIVAAIVNKNRAQQT